MEFRTKTSCINESENHCDPVHTTTEKFEKQLYFYG